MYPERTHTGLFAPRKVAPFLPLFETYPKMILKKVLNHFYDPHLIATAMVSS